MLTESNEEDDYSFLAPMKITPEYAKPLVRYIKNECKENGIKLGLVNKRLLKTDVGPCSGYFSEEEEMLAVAVDRDPADWLPVLAHESCHMDQWREDAKAWQVCMSNGHDSYTLMNAWLSGEVEFNTTQLKNHISRVRNLEADCEARTVKRLREYKLPLDIELQIRKANSYIVFYNMVAHTRKWYTVSPTYIQPILEAMPTKIIKPKFGNFKVPRRIKELYLKHVF